MNDPYQYIPPEGNGSEHECPSNTGWIVGLVILFLIALGLGIWLLVLYVGGHVGGSNDRLIALPNAAIIANSNTISGTWGQLDDDNDKVTLYVSEKPFVFNNDGTITCDNSIVKCDTEEGSKNTAEVQAITNTSYNAMLIATGNGTCHYRVYGPVKVFTQTNVELKTSLFNIRDLNTCNGSVSDTLTYSTTTDNIGIFRHGSSMSTNDTSKLFLVQHTDNDPSSETDRIICRAKTGQNLILATWTNQGDSTTATPVICTSGTDAADCNASSDAYIPNSNCTWSYNTNPAKVAGLNKWCLAGVQAISPTNNNTEIACMSTNGTGNSLIATNNLISESWFNSFVGSPFVTLAT